MFGKKLSLHGDRSLWTVIVVLFVFSTIAVYSSTGTLAYKYRDGNTLFYLFRHLMFLITGFGIVYGVQHIKYSLFSRLANVLYYGAIMLLAFTLLLGTSKNAATRWLTLPFLGVMFQPSDFAKFALIVYVAKVLSEYQTRKSEFLFAFRHIMIASVITCGLIVPENLSTAAMLFAIVFLMMYVGRMPMKYLYTTMIGAVIGIFILVILIFALPETGRFSTWRNRVESFISSDSQVNYQAEQSKIAVATGGFTGKKPGNGTQKNFLPQAYSDFIYAIIIEEFGSLFGVLILLVYTIIIFRIGPLTKRCPTAFPALLASGLAISLVLQAFINMGVAVNIIPVTGQPLPFVSMGGTSILFTSVSLGVILGISAQIEGNKPTAVMKSDS